MPVLLADPEITSLPVLDSGEPLVPVPFDTADPDGARPLVRSGVAARLAVAQLLLPPGRRLRVVEGHRRPDDQLAIWRRYAAEVATAHPAAGAAEQRRLTSRFVSPIEVAPHVAGAAVDVLLVDRLGRPSTSAPRSTRPRRRAAAPASPTPSSGPRRRRSAAC